MSKETPCGLKFRCLGKSSVIIKSLDKNQVTWKCTAKGCRGRSQSPRLASAEAKSLRSGKSGYGRKTSNLVAPIWRDTAQLLGRSAWGARLRTREVRGRDASLPAPLWAVPFELVARATVGALPQTPQGTLALDPARDRRKGTKSPLDPFWAARLERASLLPFCLSP